MFQTVGKPVPRKEGRQKVTGESKYVDDLSFPGMLHGVTVRSPLPRGRIRNIEFTGDLPWHEFTIVTAQDIPGENCVALIVDDQPCLAAELVNHADARREVVPVWLHQRAIFERARLGIVTELHGMPPASI